MMGGRKKWQEIFERKKAGKKIKTTMDEFFLYVNTKNNIPPALNEYVLWVDIMGTRGTMSVSIQRSANFLFKLHQAIQKASKGKNLKIYPVMDAAYVTSKTKGEILSFINALFTILSLEFIRQDNPEHQFLVRGALSYGPIYHARNLIQWMHPSESKNKSYWEKVLLGIPVIQAFSSEEEAPPMGVFIHETARAFAPNRKSPLPYAWDVWQVPTLPQSSGVYINKSKLWRELNDSIISYFDWCKRHSLRISYPTDAIEKHQKLWETYYRNYQKD